MSLAEKTLFNRNKNEFYAANVATPPMFLRAVSCRLIFLTRINFKSIDFQVPGQYNTAIERCFIVKEINIARVLVSKRKEKGITQDELASYMGVSKASVSKWETGQSYPDVTFLPQLAAYFNISIDELMDYQPQMAKEDIRKLYRRLSTAFTEKPFDAVLEEYNQIIRKYYACFPLLLQMGILLINHLELVKDQSASEALLAQSKALFVRVREESGDVSLTKQAMFMEALACLISNDPNAALELLEGTIVPAMPPESLLASAYQMTGRMEDAKEVLQVGMYQNIVVLFNFLPAYLMLCLNDPKKFEETLKRGRTVVEAFDMKHLHPSVAIGLYLSAAQGYCMQQNYEKALDMLEEYAQIVTGNIYPLRLQGDDFFDRLNPWLEQLDLGTGLPRDETTIKKSMLDVMKSPAFAALAQEERYLSILERLKNSL